MRNLPSVVKQGNLVSFVFRRQEFIYKKKRRLVLREGLMCVGRWDWIGETIFGEVQLS